MANYKKRGNGWQARISWYSGDGQRHNKSKAGFPTKLLAKQWATEQEAKLNQGVNIGKEITLVDYYDQWVKTYKEPKVAPITMHLYRLTGNRLKTYFPGVKIKDITRGQYQEFINWYGKDHAPQSVKKLNMAVRGCVRSAILDDYLIKDFTQGVTLTANDSKKVKVDYLNLAEIKQLIEATQAGITKHRYTSRYMILTAIYTGMRLSEIQALTWKDIDFIHHTISINKSWNAADRSFKPTKNKSSVRTIKINHKLIALLKQLAVGRQSNLVFMNQYGTVPTSNAVNKTLRSLLEALNIHRSGFHFHSLRHSHVALLLAKDVDIYAISKRLGHSNTATTSQIYAYLIDEYKDQTDNQIVTILDNI